MPKIVTLLPSATEIICALGFEDDLIGRSHECDFPASVTRLPTLTAPKFKVQGTSAEIDRRVKKIVSDALSVYRVDPVLLRTLGAEVIVTQSQCQVCAVSESDVEAAVANWMGARPKIVSLAPYKLADIFSDITRVAIALEAPERAAAVVARLRGRMDAIALRASVLESRPTFACVEWLSPLMSAGNWMPELAAMAGGRNLFGRVGEHSPWMKLEELAAADPDVIMIAPCGFPIARTTAELPVLSGDPRWRELRAVREGRVFIADGNQYFNRPGPRIAESLEILAEMMHPEAFHFGHEGTGWQRI